MSPRFDRRALLRGGLAVGAATLLPACGTSSGNAANGVLRAAFVGGGAAETLTPFADGNALDFVRARAVHNTLGDLDLSAPEGVRYNALSGIDIAADLSEYTLRVRPGATFTDGSPVTARDVAYSLEHTARHGKGSYATFVQDFDMTRIRVTDEHTVVLPTKHPIADGREILCMGTNFVFKDGTTEFTATTPSCGPFKLTGFDPGRGATLTRHDGYRGDGDGPYLRGLELLSIPDGEARLNALRGGQVDFAHELTPVQARTLAGQNRFTVTESGQPSLAGLTFSMNMTSGPFTDVRVRQAFKFAVNRQAMIDTALLGRGVPGNDLYSLGFNDYAADIPQRPHDPGRAAALLAEAGATDLPITLTTGPETPGMVEAATLYAENLREVGVKVTIDQRPPGQIYADTEAYSRLPFVGAYSSAVPPLMYYQVVSTAGNPYGFGWNRPDIDARVLTARATAAPEEARRLSRDIQRVLWDEGNTVIPVYKPVVNAQVATLSGVDKGLFEQYPAFTKATLA